MLILVLAANEAPAAQVREVEQPRPPHSAVRPEDFPGGPVDIVIDREQLEAHIAAMEANPLLYDGLVVGVWWDPGPVEDVAVAQLDARQRTAIIGAGGERAAKLDQELARRQDSIWRGQADATSAPAADCARQRGRQPPPPPPPPPSSARDVPTVAFACAGDDPFTGDLPRAELAVISDAEDRLLAALRILENGPTDDEVARGYHSLLQGEDVIDGLWLREGVATISFTSALEDLRLQSHRRGGTFVEQLLNTAFAVPGVTGVRGEIDGDCLRFAYAVSGDMCVTFWAHEGTNSQLRDEAREKDMR
jgi:hypothetical protein